MSPFERLFGFIQHLVLRFKHILTISLKIFSLVYILWRMWIVEVRRSDFENKLNPQLGMEQSNTFDFLNCIKK